MRNRSYVEFDEENGKEDMPFQDIETSLSKGVASVRQFETKSNN